MTGPAVTRWLLLAVVAGLALYDVAVIRACGNAASISCVVHDFARQHPAAALAVGVVVVHVFWPLVER